MICVSTHPTINQLLDPIIEVHIIDFDENIYGDTIYVDLIDYMRDVQVYNSLDELKQQLEIDREKVKKSLQ